MSPLSGSPTGQPWKEMPVTRTLLYIIFRVPSKGTPSRFPSQSAQRERCSISRVLFQLSLRVSGERTPLVICIFLEVPGKWAPLHIPQQGPYGGRCSISRANGLFINLYPSESPVKEPSHENGENIRSPSTEPHANGRPTYNEVWPGSPKGSFTTMLSLPQCHAACITIPSTLDWVDQSPVSQRVS